jgi:hypothetical protein
MLHNPSAELHKLTEYLREHCRGLQNAMRLPDLAAAVCLSQRLVQLLIEDCRGIRGDDVICSSTGGAHPGLYITDDPAEVAQFHHQLEHREMANRRRRLAIERRFPQLRTVTKRKPPYRHEMSGVPRQLTFDAPEAVNA